MSKLTIIGLGLIGGSLGLALKQNARVNFEVVGTDRDPDVANRAKRAGAVDRVEYPLEEAVREASVVVVATPIISMRRVFESIAPFLSPGAVVTDTASTKTEVLRWAEELLPENVDFVGGHPMAGKEKSGPTAAEASLFAGRPYCIVPGVSSSEESVHAVVGMAYAVGAKPFFLDAQEHDAYAAAISHIPLMASISLFTLAKGSVAWPELAGMAGPAFYDLTRLASGEPEMSHDICLTNRENILHWLERYIAELRKLADMIEQDDREMLFRRLAEVQLERETFLTSPPRRDETVTNVDIPSASEAFMNMMGGALWAQRSKEISSSFEERVRTREREERLRRRDDD
jgi:prephenate dehydrogenase